MNKDEIKEFIDLFSITKEEYDKIKETLEEKIKGKVEEEGYKVLCEQTSFLYNVDYLLKAYLIFTVAKNTEDDELKNKLEEALNHLTKGTEHFGCKINDKNSFFFKASSEYALPEHPEIGENWLDAISKKQPKLYSDHYKNRIKDKNLTTNQELFDLLDSINEGRIDEFIQYLKDKGLVGKIEIKQVPADYRAMFKFGKEGYLKAKEH